MCKLQTLLSLSDRISCLSLLSVSILMVLLSFTNENEKKGRQSYKKTTCLLLLDFQHTLLWIVVWKVTGVQMFSEPTSHKSLASYSHVSASFITRQSILNKSQKQVNQLNSNTNKHWKVLNIHLRIGQSVHSNPVERINGFLQPKSLVSCVKNCNHSACANQWQDPQLSTCICTSRMEKMRNTKCKIFFQCSET